MAKIGKETIVMKKQPQELSRSLEQKLITREISPNLRKYLGKGVFWDLTSFRWGFSLRESWFSFAPLRVLILASRAWGFPLARKFFPSLCSGFNFPLSRKFKFLRCTQGWIPHFVRSVNSAFAEVWYAFGDLKAFGHFRACGYLELALISVPSAISDFKFNITDYRFKNSSLLCYRCGGQALLRFTSEGKHSPLSIHKYSFINHNS